MPAPETVAMLDGMADERPRMIFDCPERFRRAVRLRMARDGKDSVSDVILEALESYLPRELSEADEAIQAGQKPPKARRGRKPGK